MSRPRPLAALALGLALTASARAQAPPSSAEPAVIEVHADQPGRPLSRLLTGACLEDVNHEVYGGLSTQMVYGESFGEPEPSFDTVRGFRALGGRWAARDGELTGTGAPGDKLVADLPPFRNGDVGVEVFVPRRGLTNAGLVVRVGRANRPGADNFDGYEVSLSGEGQTVMLGRHRQNFRQLQLVPCAIPTDRWVPLAVRLRGSFIEVDVNGVTVLRHDDGNAALPAGSVGIRQWQAEAKYRNLTVHTDGDVRPLPFVASEVKPAQVSGMWRPVRTGSAGGAWALNRNQPYAGVQSQRITRTEGEGLVGVENQGLNRQGMHFVAGQPYEGVVWARAASPQSLLVRLESRDGSKALAEQRVAVPAGGWQRLVFAVTPDDGGPGRLTLALDRTGTVDLGYAMLEPGAWGRFRGLPVRKDVGEAMVNAGITVLRYGGSMVNHPEYRWKRMIGPRDARPPHRNTWSPYSSHGWAIPEFLQFADAAGFVAVPAFNRDETPEDMADFVRYANAPAGSEWGRRRAADGHPEPFHLRHIQLGNEEKVDETYFAKFQPLAEAIWRADPTITLVVGDFDYREVIRDPDRFGGTSSKITSLAAHRKILQLAKTHDREVWFDVHVWTDGPRPDQTLPATLGLVDALERLADGARFRVVVFELNANSHDMKRAQANALAIQAFERDGRIPVVASANALQPDGQNDNGWDQGLIFLDPAKVWLQPPGYVTQLTSQGYLPLSIPCRVGGPPDGLDAVARTNPGTSALVVQVVNPTDQPRPATLNLHGFDPSGHKARITELSGPPRATNTAAEPEAIAPRSRDWTPPADEPRPRLTFPPHSITVIRWD